MLNPDSQSYFLRKRFSGIFRITEFKSEMTAFNFAKIKMVDPERDI